MNIQKRKHFGGVAAGNNDNPRPAIAHNLLQNDTHTRIGIGLVATGMKGRQSSVVIEQQGGLGGFRNLAQKWLELGLQA
jgi:hypothetical protein